MLVRAKVNLALHVLSRDCNGYHKVSSLVVFPEFGDFIKVVVSPVSKNSAGLHLSVHGPFAAALNSAPSNIVTRAVTSFFDEFRICADSYKLDVVLRKELPVAGGLGGGSADAAAVLNILSAYFGMSKMITVEKSRNKQLGSRIAQQEDLYFRSRLLKIAAKLGADVPVCLSSKSAVIEGVGEIVRFVQLPAFAILLLSCCTPIATQDVFQKVEMPRGKALPELPEKFNNCYHLFSYLRSTRNELASVSCKFVPEIMKVIDVLGNCHNVGFYGMSGTGPSCFALFSSIAEADAAKSSILAAYPDWWCVSSVILASAD